MKAFISKFLALLSLMSLFATPALAAESRESILGQIDDPAEVPCEMAVDRLLPEQPAQQVRDNNTDRDMKAAPATATNG